MRPLPAARGSLPLDSERVLVTGGAGFIGSHVVDRLVERGKAVVVLDSLEPQVHGPERARPAHLHADVELVVGDVRDRALVERLVGGVDAVIHLAATVGLAQSLYEIERFVDVNCRGTALVLEAAVAKGSRVRKLVVASSMSLYGEGRCECPRCGSFDPQLRPRSQLEQGDFEIRCPRCAAAARPLPTPEEARLQPTTVYAVSKRDQEELALCVGAAYRLPVTALRLFNVYGPRQSLSNPYTGVGSIFCSRLLAGREPVVFEDGGQSRDFTHVSDVAEAFARALDSPAADGKVLNVGAGRSLRIDELGQLIARELGVEWRPRVTRSFRQGDIRHCTAATVALEAALGFSPRVRFEEGVRDLVAWARLLEPHDQVDRAIAELKERGLL
jgi:dTDP-L-rhamnose 4-epimerase